MPRALLARFVLFVATVALGGCGLFKFGTLEFLPSDGSTLMELGDMLAAGVDLATNETDGGTTPPDMNCNPVLSKKFGSKDLVKKDDKCWVSDATVISAKAYSVKDIEVPVSCYYQFSSHPIMIGKNYSLNVTYQIRGVDGNPARKLRITPHIMDLDAVDESSAPYFDFLPSPRNGTYSTEIAFRATKDVLNLVLDLQYYKITGPETALMQWSISDITLSTSCPR